MKKIIQHLEKDNLTVTSNVNAFKGENVFKYLVRIKIVLDTLATRK